MHELSTETTFRERTSLDRNVYWFLVGGNRWVVAGGIALIVFTLVLGFGALTYDSTSPGAVDGNTIQTIFAGLVGAIITGTILVVTINQLVLSQELGSLEVERNRMEGALDFHERADSLLDTATPNDPAGMLSALIVAITRRATELRGTLADSHGQDLRSSVDRLADGIDENADLTLDQLATAEFGTFAVVSAALDFDYNRRIHAVQQLRDAHEEGLSEAEQESFTALLDAITFYGVVREYVKDLYIQWALVELSRGILYAAVVALTVAGSMAIIVTPGTFPGTFLGIQTILWVVSAAFAVSTLPFLIFTSYILRLATMTKLTLSAGVLVVN